MKWMIAIAGAMALLFAALGWVAGSGWHDTEVPVTKAASPDGSWLAELIEVVTPMHGGPDTLIVRLRERGDVKGIVVYDRNYECGPADYTAYKLEWRAPRLLSITYGDCDARNPAVDNIESLRLAAYKDVQIVYEHSTHVAQGMTNRLH